MEISAKIVRVFQTFSELKKKIKNKETRFRNRQKAGPASRVQSVVPDVCV